MSSDSDMFTDILCIPSKCSTRANGKPKPTALAVPVPHQFPPVTQSHAQVHVKVAINPDYLLFTLEGFVSVLEIKTQCQ